MGGAEYYARCIGNRLKQSVADAARRFIMSMTARTHPLELILRATGPAELVNADEEVLWISESDDQFKEEFSDEFLSEEDIPSILDYLRDTGVITQMEFNALNSDRWDCTIETIDTGSETPPEEDDEDDGDDWEDEDEDEDDDDI